jgi:hypothetical protein
MSNSEKILDYLKENASVVSLGVTSSPSNTLEITIDIREESKLQRTLGQMVFVVVNEDGQNVLVMGQVVSIETKNRWHEDQAFKGVIKRYGSLPHLSGSADNRIANISVQACYSLGTDDPSGYVLGTSPSTGERVEVMTNEVMKLLMAAHENDITYLGRFYNTNVDAPFWFKHFGETDVENGEAGAGDAYHIGVFGKTGSGKSNTAANMLLGYAKNSHNMSILVLDPQGQFYNDLKLLPGSRKLEDEVKKTGMTYEKLHILKDVYLPGDMYELFGELLIGTNFIQEAFKPIYTDDKIEAVKDGVVGYFLGRANSGSFNLNDVADNKALLKEMLTKFATHDAEGRGNSEFSKFVVGVYGTTTTRERLQGRVESLLANLDNEFIVLERWDKTLNLFKKRINGTEKVAVSDLVKKMVTENGHFVVLNLLDETVSSIAENLQAVFINVIERKIVEQGAEIYSKGSANCMIVMDEAHRFISQESNDPRIKELTREIMTSVRTTRKYGIGYMFITQTIESLDEEILKQMRIFAFGYGLTSGSEIRRIRDYINNDAAIQLYRSFIDPSSNRKYPFMFFGPISPLSFTGSPLFIEMYNDSDFEGQS